MTIEVDGHTNSFDGVKWRQREWFTTEILLDKYGDATFFPVDTVTNKRTIWWKLDTKIIPPMGLAKKKDSGIERT